MPQKQFNNLSINKETIEQVRAFIRYRSLAQFAEAAIQEKLERERAVEPQVASDVDHSHEEDKGGQT